MRSILATPAGRILHVSRIYHGNGTLTHYRGLRDDGVRGRGSTYDPSAPRSASAGSVWRPGRPGGGGSPTWIAGDRRRSCHGPARETGP